MLNILYVEDDENSRSVVRIAQRMTPDKFVLTIFDDSQNFEDRLVQLTPPPDLILLDIHVKPYTGFEMLAKIRTHSEYNAVPVVALTASVMNEEIQMLQSAGFDSAISKPLDIEALSHLIERIMTGEHIWYIW